MEEEAVAKTTKKGKKGGRINLTDMVEEHDTKMEQLLDMMQHEVMPRFPMLETTDNGQRSDIEKILKNLEKVNSGVADCAQAADGARQVQTEFGAPS